MKKGLVLILIFILLTVGLYFLRTKKLNLFKSTTENSKTTGNTIPTGILIKQISLDILQPTDKSIVSSPELVVKGKTLAGADVFVNEQEAKADNMGNFSITVSLEEGDNNIIAVVNDSKGNYSERELTVTLVTQE